MKLRSELALACRSRGLWLTGLVAASVVVWWRPLVETFGLALSRDTHTHILLIIPLSAALAYLNRTTTGAGTRSLRFGGATLMTVALIIGGATQWAQAAWPDDVRLSISMLAMVTWSVGSFVAVYGLEVLRSFFFPLAILYWLVPLPDFALNKIVFALQHVSAVTASIFLQGSGIAVTRDGTLLSLADWDVDVAPECSSIRSSLMLVITTMVLAHLFLRSRWRKAVLIAAVVPLAAFKNGLRIFTLVEIATRDPRIFDSDLHHRGGVVFFAISVAMTILLLWLLRRTEIEAPQRLDVGGSLC